MKDKYAEFKRTTYETAKFRSFPSVSMEMIVETDQKNTKEVTNYE